MEPTFLEWLKPCIGGKVCTDFQDRNPAACSGAAGEISDAELADGVGVGPVHTFQLRYRQPGEQCRRSRQGIECGQVLPVGDKVLEDAAGQVVSVVDASGFDSLGGLQEVPQHGGGSVPRNLFEDVLGNGEDWPVVDLQDVGPGRKRIALRIGHFGAGHQAQGFHPLVQPGDALVEHHGVGDDRAGHAAGLGHVAHSQQPGDDGGNVGS